MRPLLVLLACLAQGAPARIPIDDFEKEPQGWKYVGGEEFPGAKGSFEIDPAVAHSGKASFRLQADFTGGGAYVGTWRNLDLLKGRDFKELRLWVKAAGVSKLGVRLLDASDQIHQRGIPLAATPDWQEVVLKVSDFVAVEHWGGANDGKWHGPCRGFGLNVGKDGSGPAKGTLWIDDLEALPGPAIEGHPTIHVVAVHPPSCRPGQSTRITYRWDAEPMGRDLAAFVHFNGAKGMAFQHDHGPSKATSVWSGRVEYTRTLLAPENAADGEYAIVAGLWDSLSGGRLALKAGPGVVDLGGQAYQLGVLRIDSQAPLPKLPAPTLKLDAFKLTWSDEFNDLSVSAWGPGTRWIAHTPYGGDFGDARFADPKGDAPFKIEDGKLRIEAVKEGKRWRGGLISSVDAKGDGFSQKYGYFEMRAKFPKSPGMWPAFWLMGSQTLKDKSITNPEIDVVEQYGAYPKALHATLHLWGPGSRHDAEGDVFIAPGMDEDFHTYGAMLDEKEIVWYWDGIELWRLPTTPEAKVPLYVMVDLAMGGGWPIDQALSPSYLYVDHVRVYARR